MRQRIGRELVRSSLSPMRFITLRPNSGSSAVGIPSLPAAELARLGVVEAVVPADELLPKAMALARTIAAKSPVAVRLAKGALNTIEGMGVRDGYRFEQDVTVALSATEDAQEARRAFVEKRKPVFKGR